MAMNDPLNLDEAGEWAGLYWLPDAPDEHVPGVLQYDPEADISRSMSVARSSVGSVDKKEEQWR